MGTRNLTMVMRNGLFEVAQYGQWDGYPDGNGVTVLDFCRKYLSTKKGRAEFAKQLDKTTIITKEEVVALWRELGADDSGFVSPELSAKFKEKLPYLHRDIGAAILDLIRTQDGVKLQLDTEFAADSLFCEWAYLIDLKKNTLEVYKGFNKKPLEKGQRFRFLEGVARSGNGYHPIRLVKSYNLSRLPTEKKFLADLVPADEE